METVGGFLGCSQAVVRTFVEVTVLLVVAAVCEAVAMVILHNYKVYDVLILVKRRSILLL